MDFINYLRKHSGALIIIFPIILMVIGLTGSSARTASTRVIPSPIPVTPSLVPTEVVPTDSTGSPEAKINLKGPLSCTYTDAEKTATIYAKDSTIYVSNQKSTGIFNMLFKGDCVYVWQNGLKSGDKACGVSPYIGLIGNYTPSQLLGMMGNTGVAKVTPKTVTNPIVTITPVHTCTEKAVPIDKLQLPIGVVFKEKALTDINL